MKLYSPELIPSDLNRTVLISSRIWAIVEGYTSTNDENRDTFRVDEFVLNLLADPPVNDDLQEQPEL